MKQKGVINEADYKKIEKILFEYGKSHILIRRNEIEIDLIRLHSSNDLTRDEHARIDELVKQSKELMLVRDMVDSALNVLDESERELIEDRYFKKVSIDEIKSKRNCVRTYVYVSCRKIIEKKLMKYIVV